MTVDRYTKLVLTVIAVSLAWIAAGGPSITTPVDAQSNNGQRVVLAGWLDANNNVRPFPNPVLPSGNRQPGDGRGPITPWGLPIRAD